MLERVDRTCWFCNNCSHDWVRPERLRRDGGRFASLDDLIAAAGLRRDEVVTLADIGALNSFGYDRRSALWQAERAVRPVGRALHEQARAAGRAGTADALERHQPVPRIPPLPAAMSVP